MNRYDLPRRLGRGVAALVGLAALAGCSLDLVNPNGPLESDVLNNPELLLTSAVGLQAQYADNALIFVRAPELVTDQWGTRPLALAADQSLVRGNPDPTFGVVSDPFSAAYRVARSADVLIERAPQVNLSRGQQLGIASLARLLKAMAIGHLTTQYTQMPANYNETGAPPLPRDQVRDTVIALLERARTDVASLTPAELTAFRMRVLDPSTGANTGIDLANTINAMLARYYLFDGQPEQALAAAQRVNLATRSLIQYPNPGQNPIWQYGLSLNYVGARKDFFVDAAAGDARPAFWANRGSGQAGLPDSTFLFLGFAGSRNDAVPLYLPDEMRLIQAEAHARANNFPEARRLINEVRTQGRTATGGCTAIIGEPVACLPPLPDAALDTRERIFAQILYERRYELFSQGVRWEDLRRLREFTTDRPSIEFLPYPQAECDRNPNSGC